MLSTEPTKIKPRTGEDIDRQPAQSGRIAQLSGKKSNTDSSTYSDCKIGRNNKPTDICRHLCACTDICNANIKWSARYRNICRKWGTPCSSDTSSHTKNGCPCSISKIGRRCTRQNPSGRANGYVVLNTNRAAKFATKSCISACAKVWKTEASSNWTTDTQCGRFQAWTKVAKFGDLKCVDIDDRVANTTIGVRCYTCRIFSTTW